MIGRTLFIALLLLSSLSFSQTYSEFEIIESDTTYYGKDVLRDSLYAKDDAYSMQRTIKSDLKDKYSGREFTYVDDLKERERKKTSSGLKLGKGFSYFMSSILPILLAIFVVFIVAKSFVNIDPAFWKLRRKDTQVKKLIANEDDIDEADYDKLLQLAIDNQDYRLATRYYYLSLLKLLAENKFIEYHKDKTNSDYLFELKDKKMRSKFSYLSYIYSYVWYGEFPLSEPKFVGIKQKYQSFIKTIQ